MVVAAGGDEGRVVADPLLQLEAEHAAVEVQRPVEVGHFEVDVADVDAGVDRLSHRRSRAALTRRSASALCSRRTWRIDQPLEGPQRPLHLGVQLAQRRVLDLVLALDLAHDQLRVADQLQLARPQLRPPARSRAAAPGTRRRCWSPRRSARRAPRAPRRRCILDDGADRRRARVAAGAAVDVHDQLHGKPSLADRLAVAGLAVARPAPSTSCPPSPARAFHCRAEPSSCSISLPLSSWKTARISSPRSTPHWYQQSSQATVIRTSLGEPAAEPIETCGSPQRTGQPGDGARCVARVEARHRPLQPPHRRLRPGGLGAAADVGAGGRWVDPAEPLGARPRQRSQTSRGPSFGLM